MDEAGLRTVLLAQACEEADPEGAFVPHAAREVATRALDSADSSDPAELLRSRAASLVARVLAEQPVVETLARRTRFTPPAGPVLAVAFALGLAADGLGRERQLNLLAFPLLGLVVWNLAVYAVGLARRLVRRGGAAPLPGEAALAWSALRVRFQRRAGADSAFGPRAASRFAALWLERAGALEAERWRARLHAGAAAFALGVIVGLYLAGLAFAYRATWESTFLTADAVRALLVVLLGPASALLGAPLPDTAALAALQAPASGPADLWIHRWAVTAGLLVVLPRLLLAARCAARSRAAAGRLAPDLDGPYATRILAVSRGEGASHAILPYSMEPNPSAAARLRELAHDLFGNRARVSLLPYVPYGGEAPADASADSALLVVFDLAQSPEREVHGAFLEALGAAGASCLVVLDLERYADVAPPERVEERRRAWGRVLREVGATPIDLAPEISSDALIEAARAALPREAVCA